MPKMNFHFFFFFFFFSFFCFFVYPYNDVHILLPSEAAAELWWWLSSENVDAGNAAANIPALFVFGDSMSDTGNGPFVNHFRAYSLPFGETYPGYANGRFSDGRTIIGDYLAAHLGLRPLNPWLNVFLDFDEGANYAIPGSTVLPDIKPMALPVQVSWHIDELVDAVLHINSSSSSAMDRKRLPTAETLHDALYVISTGGLDYKNYYDTQGYPPEVVNATIVPLVVEEIRLSLEALYERGGARRLAVGGVMAQGCQSFALATFPGLPRDSLGCVDPINSIAANSAVQTVAMLRTLAQLHPDASYAFLDYLGAHQHILQHAHLLGFGDTLNACCGAGSRYPYGYNFTAFTCSNDTEALYVCPNPASFVNWDGLHFTDTFNFQMFNHTFLTGAFMYPINYITASSAQA